MKDAKERKGKIKKAAKGVEIVFTVLSLLFGLFMLGVLTFVGVSLWKVIAPLFGL